MSTMPESDVTRYDHLMSIAEQSDEPPPELDGPDFPEIISHVWGWFSELSAARGEGPISYSEIKAWSEVTGRTPSSFEIEIIKQLDTEFMKSRAKQLKSKTRK